MTPEKVQIVYRLDELKNDLAQNKEKKAHHTMLSKLDQSVQFILSRYDLAKKESRIKLRSSSEIYQEIKDLPDDPKAGMMLIASTILQDIDQKLRHDLGTYLFDESVGYRIRGTLYLKHIDGTSSSDSPQTKAAKTETLLRRIKNLGLIAREYSDGKLCFHYVENQKALSEYFKTMHAAAKYELDSVGIIDRVHLSIPLRGFTPIEAEPESENHKAGKSETLTEQEYFTLEKTIQEFRSALRASDCEDLQDLNKDLTFPSLFASYMYQIEDILLFNGSIYQDQEKRFAATRQKNLDARSHLESAGRQMMTRHSADLYSAMNQIIEAFDAYFENTGFVLNIDGLQFHSHHHMSIQLLKSGLPSRNLKIPMFERDDSREIRIPNTQENRDFILQMFRKFDPQAVFSETTTDENNAIRKMTIDLYSVDAIQRFFQQNHPQELTTKPFAEKESRN